MASSSRVLRSLQFLATRTISSMSTVEAVAQQMSREYGELVSYTPPVWARELSVVPRQRYVLCMRPTPIHRWKLRGVPDTFSLSIKRDDMTGSTLTGNKVRAMEFHLAEARARGCDVVVTVGGLQSNHCRTTAIAARMVDLDCHLLLISNSADSLCNHGNMLLNRISGAHIIPLTSDLTEGNSLNSLVEQYSDKLRSMGRVPYTVPAGGHSVQGLWGYISAFQEMMEWQGLWERFSDIVVCSGSGGTSSALAISNYLTGSKIKVHAVAIPVPGCVPIPDLQNDMRSLGIGGVAAEDILDVIDGYEGEGYSISDKHLEKLMVEIFSTTAMSLDTTYTAKTVRGLLTELQTSPDRFQGRDILFIHTGGVFSLFDGSLDDVMESTPVTNQIIQFHD